MSPKKSLSKKSPNAVDPSALPLVAGQDLRRQAEAQLKKTAPLPAPQADTQRLIYELQVHQIELEMQNEELVQARAETEAALNQYIDLYDFAPVGYFTLGRDGMISKVNLAGANLLGAGAERGKLIRRRLGIFVSAEFRPQFNAFLDRVFTSRENEVCEIKLLKDGSTPLWAHLEAITDSDQRETCSLVAVDISESKQAEEALRESEEKHRALIEQSLDGIVISDEHGNVAVWNKSMESITGIQQRETIGRPLWEIQLQLIPDEKRTPELLGQLQNSLKNILESKMDWPGESREQVIIHVNGTHKVVQDSSYTIKINNCVQFGSIIRDITERKKAEEALHESEEKWHSLVTASPDYIALLDREGRYLFLNHYAEGFTEKDVIGSSAFQYLSPESKDLFRKKMEECLRTLLVQLFEFSAMGNHGTFRTYEQYLVPIVSAKNETEILAIARDITERKQAEDVLKGYNTRLETAVEVRTRELREAQEKLVHNEKLAVLGQLAGGVGHELRNPLGVIKNAIYYLNMVQPDADEKVRQYHAMIEQEVQNSGKIINDLLDFARGISADRETVSVPELVQSVLIRFPAPPSVEVTLKLSADLPKVFADPRQMEQVLGNLTTNACQAMINGGKLTITAHTQKKLMVIAVNDTGTGITPENMKKVFEPLFTTKCKGIGLGLAISRKLVEANDGRIEVQSQPGKGSTFTVTLPVQT